MAEAVEGALLAQRLSVLSGELRYAWDRSDSADLQRWGIQTAADFGRVFKRRVTNFAELLGMLGVKTVAEVRGAFVAYGLSNLEGHLRQRAAQVGASVSGLYDRAVDDLSLLNSALTNQPAEVAPKLLTALVTSLLVSGGPNGDGGAPDLDLMFGIGAHRSILSHSILMGAALETAFLSLLRLVRLVHSKLPAEHAKGWDDLLRQSDPILNGAISGAGLGMAYHLVIDGLVQPAALHGLPFAAPMPVHLAATAGSGFIEAQDLFHKDQAAKAPRQAASARSDAEEAELHKAYLRRPTEVGGMVAPLLPAECLSVIQRHGAWMSALADGTLRPTTPAQERLVQVAQWEAQPVTAHEQAWYLYSLARIAVLQTLRPSVFGAVRDWFR